MAETIIKLSGDYGYGSYKVGGLTSTVIDASDASWIVANTGSPTNRYPVRVNDGNDVTLIGGTINGKVSLTLDWGAAYVNSAAVFVRGTDDAVIEDWRINQAWDGIRIRGDTGDNFVIDNVWLSNVRDDAVENDSALTGTIKNSLFDGVFVGLSTTESGTTGAENNLVTLDNVLIRMESFRYENKETHMSPFKVSVSSPKMAIHDSIIAIEDVYHHGRSALERAWDKVTDVSGSYFLNLSDTPLPANYPTPPNGFTVLEGKEARTFWADARADWIATHDDGGTGGVDTAQVTNEVGSDLPAPEVGSDLPASVFSIAGVNLFDGSAGAVIDVPPDMSLAIPEGTIAASFIADETVSRQGLFTKDARYFSGGGNHFASFIQDGDLIVRFQDGSAEERFVFRDLVGGREYEFAATFGSGGVAIFIDGALVFEDPSFFMSWETNNEYLQVGGLGWSSQSGARDFIDPLSGAVADFEIYDEALSPDQIQSLAGMSSFDL